MRRWPVAMLLGVPALAATPLSGAWWAPPAVAGVTVAVVAGLHLRDRDRAAAHATAAAARLRERADLARELRDVVAHHIGGIVVQAQAAQVVAGTDHRAGIRALPLIERAGAEALSAVRLMGSVLGDGDPDGDVPTRTTDLAADLHAVTAAVPGGIPVRLTVEMAEPIPAEVGTSVLRLVQESVANARRHATGAHRITVTVCAGDGVARVSVRDDGRDDGRAERHGGGCGLPGMRERVQLLGGRFSAGYGPGGGWQVLAYMPLGTVRSRASPPFGGDGGGDLRSGPRPDRLADRRHRGRPPAVFGT